MSIRLSSQPFAAPCQLGSFLQASMARALTCVFLCAALLGGGVPFAHAAPPSSSVPRITLSSVGRLEFRNNGATVDVMLDVRNPTGVDMRLNALTFQCIFNRIAKADGKSTGAVTVPSNSHALVPVRLSVDQNGLTGIVSIVASGAKSVDYQLNGVAELGPMMLDVPFSQTGNIPFHH